MNNPTLGGFIAWVRSAMGISTAALPDDSVYFTYAYNVAIALVNQALCVVGPPIYMLAVYNLAGDNLVNFAQDTPPSTVFASMRAQFNCLGFVSGVISSSSDEGTSQSLVVQEAAKNFTLSNLQNLKTPWGRQYLAFAQSYGPSVWGIS